MRAINALRMRTVPPPAPTGAVSIDTRTVSHAGDGAGTITVGYRLDNDGKAYKVTTTTSLLEQWLDSGVAGDFEVRATLVSGTSPTGSALNAWLALSADQTWTLSAGAGAATTCKLTVEIRDVATQTVLDSETITVNADNTAAAGSVSIDDRDVTRTGTSGTVTSVAYKLDNDGSAYDGQGNFLEVWLDSGAAGDFQVKATLVSGDSLSSGTLGSWVQLNVDQQWVLTSTQTASSRLKIEIRDAATSTVLDSALIDLFLSLSGGGGGGDTL